MKEYLTRYIVKGGVITPGELKHVLNLVKQNGLNAISFGSRQDIVFPEKIDLSGHKDIKNIVLPNKETQKLENIVSSYVSCDIFTHTDWLTSKKYLYLLEDIKYIPTLKVNITDPKQTLVPLFTGHLNFIASTMDDYWYLYIKLPGWQKMEVYPSLIYTWDISTYIHKIEKLLIEEPADTKILYEFLREFESNSKLVREPLQLTFSPFPYYEGLNKFDLDKYWLGLYWRNNLYDVSFLEDMCDLCLNTRIGKICITPWKSFIIKGIAQSNRLQWEKLLGKFGINVRHSLLELNWHVPVANQEALNLKTSIVKTLDQNDISTDGITFGITEGTTQKEYFTTIVIEKNDVPAELVDLNIPVTFNILYARNFNPLNRDYITYAQEIDEMQLPGILMELSKKYFSQLGEEDLISPNESPSGNEIFNNNNRERPNYQCSECDTIYDELLGDIMNNIPPDTSFSLLSNDYQCPVCGAEKSKYHLMNNDILVTV